MSTNDEPDASLGDSRPENTPLTVETLALLHAGALEGAEHENARAATTHDPAAQAVLSGLDRICEQLRTLDHILPPSQPMPDFVVRRMDQELAKLSGIAERGRYRWSSAVGMGSVAAAAAVLSLVGYSVWPRSTERVQQPEAKGNPSSVGDKNAHTKSDSATSKEGLTEIADKRFTIEREDFRALMSAGRAFNDLGPLTDETIRGGCLAANGFLSTQQLAAAGRIKRGDTEGIFMMIPTPSSLGGAPGMTVLVVGTECREGIPATLSKQVLSKN